MFMTTKEEHSVEELAKNIDDAIKSIKHLQLSEETEEKVFAIKNTIELFHEKGLYSLVKIIRSTEEGKRLMLKAVKDPLVYTMLLSHGIIKQDLYTKVATVLEEVKPYLKSHGGDIELIKVENNTVYVQLHGACSGCSMSAVTLKNGVEEAIKMRLPEIKQVLTDEQTITSGFMDFKTSNISKLKNTGWIQGPAITELMDKVPFYYSFNQEQILLILIDSKITAFRNRCPHKGTPFQQKTIELKDNLYLLASDDGFYFDLTTGECVTVPYIQLEPFPVRIEGMQTWIRVG